MSSVSHQQAALVIREWVEWVVFLLVVVWESLAPCCAGYRRLLLR